MRTFALLVFAMTFHFTSGDLENRCETVPVASWSDTERAAWYQLCSSGTATASVGGPEGIETWDRSARSLSSGFLQQLLSVDAMPTGVSQFVLSGYTFPEGLELRNTDFPIQLVLNDCDIADLDVSRSVLHSSLRLESSTVHGKIILDGANISGDVELIDTTIGSDISAVNSAIQGDFTVSGSSGADIQAQRVRVAGHVTVDNARFSSLNASYSELSSGIDIVNSSRLGNVLLPEAAIEGAIVFDNRVRVDGPFTAWRVTARQVSIVESSIDSVDLMGASLLDSLTLRGATIAGYMDLETLRAEYVIIQEQSELQDVKLLGATLNSGIEIRSGAVIHGELNAFNVVARRNVFLEDGAQLHKVILSGADIGTALIVRDISWTRNSSLDLRAAKLPVVLTDASPHSWPDEIYLNATTIEVWLEPDPDHLGAHWYVENLLSKDDRFRRGTYLRLADTLVESGSPEVARRLRYLASNHERVEATPLSLQRWRLETYRATLGFGEYPVRAIVWFASLWLVGTFVLSLRARKFHVRNLVYSLDRTMPGLRLVRNEEMAPELDAPSEAWFAVQTTAGWLLTLVIIAWLATLY
jgi:uncharacterized protein YjbI with pentapeptide repeats